MDQEWASFKFTSSSRAPDISDIPWE